MVVEEIGDDVEADSLVGSQGPLPKIDDGCW